MAVKTHRFMRREEKKSPLVGESYEVFDGGRKVGRVSQAASGWWWALPIRGGNLGQHTTAKRAALVVCEGRRSR